jgi:hypothetical protein
MNTRRSTWKPVRQTDLVLTATAGLVGVLALALAIVAVVLLLRP